MLRGMTQRTAAAGTTPTPRRPAFRQTVEDDDEVFEVLFDEDCEVISKRVIKKAGPAGPPPTSDAAPVCARCQVHCQTLGLGRERELDADDEHDPSACRPGTPASTRNASSGSE